MKTINSIFLVIIFFSVIACRNDTDCHYNIYVNNRSDRAIYFDFSPLYPDTLFYDNPTSSGDMFKLNPHQTSNDGHKSCVEGYFYRVPKIIYFIYDAQLLETTPWDSVAKKYMILKRYELSLEDLKRTNWTISYPN